MRPLCDEICQKVQIGHIFTERLLYFYLILKCIGKFLNLGQSICFCQSLSINFKMGLSLDLKMSALFWNSYYQCKQFGIQALDVIIAFKKKNMESFYTKTCLNID